MGFPAEIYTFFTNTSHFAISDFHFRAFCGRVVLYLLCLPSRKLVHAAEHVAEVAGEFLTLLQDMDGEEDGVDIGGAVLHRVEGMFAVGRCIT